MRNLLKYITLVLSIITTNYAHSVSVFPEPPSINFTSPTTSDFIIAEISGNYSTPGFVLNSSPTVDISVGSINITFDISSPLDPVPSILTPFNYSVDIGQLSAGDWYLTPLFFVDGEFDNSVFSTLPSFTVSAVPTVPVPAAAWLFGSGLLGLIGVARRKKA